MKSKVSLVKVGRKKVLLRVPFDQLPYKTVETEIKRGVPCKVLADQYGWTRWDAPDGDVDKSWRAAEHRMRTKGLINAYRPLFPHS